MRYRDRNPWTLTEREVRSSAPERLQATVRALTRAKRLQVFVDYACRGLFWGLIISCAAVLAIRLGQLPYATPMVVTSLVCLALTAAAMIAWQRRPNDLQVAILADVHLNLKQKLSTAWEFARLETDPALTERLALQAVRARLPSRPERVFPLRINTWGRLTPIAGALLLLLGIVDLQRVAEPVVSEIDEVVVEQGVQLREYGRQMEARARREGLPRSTKESRNIQRLGRRMESGALARAQALSRLRRLGTELDQQRQSALSEGVEIKIDPSRLKTLAVQPILKGSRLRAMLEDLAEGRLKPGDVRFSASDERALSRLGITPEDLEAALESLEAGDDQDLREILETLSDIEEASREAEELAKAQQKIERVRENLGDAEASAAPGGEPADGALTSDEEGVGGPGGRSAGTAGEGDRSTVGRGSGHNPQGTNRRSSPFTPQTEPEGIVLKPESQLREGEVFTSEARVLPRSGRPTLATVEIDAKFTAQVEEALSKEEYPLHHKELIRRYFLNLSEGVPSEDGAATP